MRTMLSVALVTVSLAAAAAAGPFDMPEEAASGVTVGGLVDMRVVSTTKRRSWLYDGFFLPNGNALTAGPQNKLRYGGKDDNADDNGDRRAVQFAVPQASLLVDAPVLPATRLHLQANFDADFETGNGSAGLIELFSESEKSMGEHALRLKLGAFIPPISWEHPEPGWSTRYTLTPSAIGSWAGEDLRAFGGELTWLWKYREGDSLRLAGAAFSGSDQSGWVLLERGWALHDFQPDLDFSYQLRSTVDGRYVTNRPFKELDGRPGYYGRLDATLGGGLLEFRGGYWDNNADKAVQTKGSHLDVYHTAFYDYGAKYERGRLVLLAQGLKGTVESLSFAKRDYDAAFVLAAFTVGRLQLAARADSFKVDKLEEGTALTGAATWRVSPKQFVTAEFVRYEAENPAGAERSDELASLNYRLRF